MVVLTTAHGNHSGKNGSKKQLNSNTNKLTYKAVETSLPSPLKNPWKIVPKKVTQSHNKRNRQC
jgi:hypothetical protein